MLTKGATLAAILWAGEWGTPAFLAYLDMQGLEKAAVVEAHQMESDSHKELSPSGFACPQSLVAMGPFGPADWNVRTVPKYTTFLAGGIQR